MLVLGAPMMRLSDGQRGTVELIEDERRVVYIDRGERRVAPKKEQWVVEQEPSKRLRAAEIIEVALHADRALRAIDMNVPLKFWEKPALGDGIHDEALFNLITKYLTDRGLDG